MNKILLFFALFLLIKFVHCKAINDDDLDVVDLSEISMNQAITKPISIVNKTANTDDENENAPAKPAKLGIISFFKTRIRNCLQRKLKFLEKIPELI